MLRFGEFGDKVVDWERFDKLVGIVAFVEFKDCNKERISLLKGAALFVVVVLGKEGVKFPVKEFKRLPVKEFPNPLVFMPKLAKFPFKLPKPLVKLPFKLADRLFSKGLLGPVLF